MFNTTAVVLFPKLQEHKCQRWGRKVQEPFSSKKQFYGVLASRFLNCTQSVDRAANREINKSQISAKTCSQRKGQESRGMQLSHDIFSILILIGHSHLSQKWLNQLQSSTQLLLNSALVSVSRATKPQRNRQLCRLNWHRFDAFVPINVSLKKILPKYPGSVSQMSKCSCPPRHCFYIAYLQRNEVVTCFFNWNTD